MRQVIGYVAKVIKMGRINNYDTQYCYLTGWNNGVLVSARRNDKSDKFIVHRNMEKTHYETKMD